jgi:hypothetical protein
VHGAWKHMHSCAGAAPCGPQECSSQQQQQEQELQQQDPAGVSQAGRLLRSSCSSTTGECLQALLSASLLVCHSVCYTSCC